MALTLRTWHRRSAAVIGLYAFFHILIHLVSLVSIDANLHWMDVARTVYRQPLVEALLLGCVAFQAASGLRLVLRGWRQRRGLVPWLQALSGTYLALFFVVHVGAVLFGRAVLQLDTNFYYAAAGFHMPPYGLFFAPYYYLAVLALFTHLGCAAYWQCQHRTARVRTLVVALPMTAGAVVALLIVLSLAGKVQPVDMPEKYKATYRTTAA